MTTERFAVDFIHVPTRMRSHVDGGRVALLADSMAKLGLMTPITVYHGEYTTDDGECLQGPILIAGNHRLQAAQKLGWSNIECVVSKAGEVERRMWEIAENLHRAELSELERNEHIAEWLRLAENLFHGETKSRGRPGTIAAAAREIGVSKAKAHRAAKVDAIAPEAKEAARAGGLDDNQSALLKVAAAPRERQTDVVADIIRKREYTDPAEASEKRIKSVQDAYLRLSAEEKRVFLEWLEENEPAIFDTTPAGRAA